MRAAAAIVLALVLAACVEEPDGGMQPEGCTLDSECGSGKICREGACYASSTGAEFAAELIAPETRTDMLARAEIPTLGINPMNQVDVMFESSVEVTGRVVLRTGDDRSVAATVEFRRPSRIAGAADYVVIATALPGKAPGEAAFRTRIARTEGTEKYAVTVYPDDGTATQVPVGTQPPSALAPPTQLSPRAITADESMGSITLDAGGLRAVSGRVVDAAGMPMSGMIVRAWNRRTPTAPYELVSSTALTDVYGEFVIYVPLGRASVFDLHVKPSPGLARARLLRKDVRPEVLTSSTTKTVVVAYPEMLNAKPFQLPVEGPDPAGGSRAPVGATVLLSTVLATGIDTVTYEASGDVAASGVEVRLIPGSLATNRTYKVTVLPLPNAPQGSTWDAEVVVGPGVSDAQGGVLPKLVLPRRVPVSGKLLDDMDRPANKMTVSPRLSPQLVSQITDEEQLARLGAIRLPEVTTDGNGVFTMYLDGRIAGRDAVYDLELVPPSASALPRWSTDAVAVAADADKVEVPPLKLPAAALVSGVVKDEDGMPVAAAEVRVYMRDGATSARQRAIAKSDAQGKISLVLPAP